jgi:hypothetical protein
MAETHTCRRCAAEAEPGEPLCSTRYLQMAALEAMETCHKLDVESAVAERKLATLN